jgi:5-methyltetrahydrofolate--homocysteine methyltransferase
MSAAGDSATRAGRLVVQGGVLGDRGGDAEADFAARLRRDGFSVLDLGDDVSPAQFAGAIREHRPLAVALACHRTALAGGVARVVEELERQRLRDTVRVLLTGAGATPDFAREVGADGYAPDPIAGAAMLRAWFDA